MFYIWKVIKSHIFWWFFEELYFYAIVGFKEFGVIFLPSSVNHKHNKFSILDKKKSDDIGKISRGQ